MTQNQIWYQPKLFMSHIHRFEVENFRVFSNRTQFEFAPITILTGTNSAGKSSLIRALMLMGASINEQPELNQLAFSKTPSLGDFKTALNDGACEASPYIKFTLPIHLDYLEGNFQLELWYEQEAAGLRRDGRLTYFHIYNEDGEQRQNLVLLSLLPFDEVRFAAEHPKKWNKLSEEEQNERRTSYVYTIQINFSFLKEQLSKNINRIESERALREAKATLDQEEDLFYDDFDESSIMEPFAYNFYDSTKLRHLRLSSDWKAMLEESKLTEAPNLNEQTIFEPSFPMREPESKNIVLAVDLTQGYSEEIHVHMKAAEAEMMDLFTKGATWMINFEASSRLPLWLDIQSNGNSVVENKYVGDALFSNIFDVYHAALEKYRKKELLTFPRYTEYGNLFLKKLLIDNIAKGLSLLPKQLDIAFLNSSRGTQRRYFAADADDRGFHLLIENFLRSGAMDVLVIRNFLNYWIDQFGIGDKISVELSNSSLTKSLILYRKEKQINLADLGFGVSQFIPFLLNMTLTAARHINYFEDKPQFNASVLSIEEPEANLHPALQSKIADLLIDAAYKFKIQFIVETHSEYLVRKFQYWTAKKIIGPEAVSIYYFYDPKNIPPGEDQVKEICIDEDGKLSDDFGTGFFDEADKIAISIWNMTQANKN